MDFIEDTTHPDIFDQPIIPSNGVCSVIKILLLPSSDINSRLIAPALFMIRRNTQTPRL